MRRCLALIAVVLGGASATCNPFFVAFPCSAERACVDGERTGRCEPTGYCSFGDPSCPSGRRYGRLAPDPMSERCVAVVCGDRMTESGEECDDGNTDDTDACLSTCRWARCGDGHVRASVEECDDGNTDDADACPSTCVLCSGAEAFMLPDNRHCYTRHAGPASWQVAREACADAGGHLATYTTEFESTRVAATLLRTNDAWIGLFYRIMVQNIQWVTEEPLLVTQWRRNEGTFGNGICIQQGSTVPGAPEPGLWFGAPCTREASYVCERAGWLLRSDDNHAYRAFYKLVTWDQAAAACAAVGGHLATITSDKEKDFVAAFSGSLWLGAHDKDQDGVFAWTTGEPFAYHNFAPNEPDNAIKGVDCIAVTNDRLWRDRGCSDIYGFLCEIE